LDHAAAIITLCLNFATICRRWSLPDLQVAVFAAIQAALLLHSKGLVHADLRPGNILWCNNKAFVIDLEQVHKAGYKV